MAGSSGDRAAHAKPDHLAGRPAFGKKHVVGRDDAHVERASSLQPALGLFRKEGAKALDERMHVVETLRVRGVRHVGGVRKTFFAPLERRLH